MTDFQPTDESELTSLLDIAISLVRDEVGRAQRKFPTWPTDPIHALGVVAEEFGELSKAVVQQTYEPHKNRPDELRKEAIQCAAMALRFVMSLDAYEVKPCDQHGQDFPVGDTAPATASVSQANARLTPADAEMAPEQPGIEKPIGVEKSADGSGLWISGDLIANVRALHRERTELRASLTEVETLLRQQSSTCICGCAWSEHENYGEDGISCENESHECLLASVSVAAVVSSLRGSFITAQAEIERLKTDKATLLKAALNATNGWACYAKRDIEHNEIQRLHLLLRPFQSGGAQ